MQGDDYMKPKIEDIISEINSEANENNLFWVCETAKTWKNILKNYLDELNPLAKMAVQHYLGEDES